MWLPKAIFISDKSEKSNECEQKYILFGDYYVDELDDSNTICCWSVHKPYTIIIQPL